MTEPFVSEPFIEPDPPPVVGAELLARAIKNAAEPRESLGANRRGVIASVSTNLGGLVSVTVTDIPGLANALVIDVEDCTTWFQAEVNALGADTSGIGGRGLLISFQPNPDGTTQYTAVSTVGR